MHRLHLDPTRRRQVDRTGCTHERVSSGSGVVQDRCRPRPDLLNRIVHRRGHPLQRRCPLGEFVDQDVGNEVCRAAVILVHRRAREPHLSCNLRHGERVITNDEHRRRVEQLGASLLPMLNHGRGTDLRHVGHSALSDATSPPPARPSPSAMPPPSSDTWWKTATFGSFDAAGFGCGGHRSRAGGGSSSSAIVKGQGQFIHAGAASGICTPDLRMTSALRDRANYLVPMVLGLCRYGQFRVIRGGFGFNRGHEFPRRVASESVVWPSQPHRISRLDLCIRSGVGPESRW
ncbi:unannotated protein [freshwater metagenome]|uniref:Unannotated protein n=1 Tax=freshwater metagenome TaxID=449393 RepID=A0A6J6U3H3_9ZZZZ